MKTLIHLIAKYWHPKNVTKDLVSTFIGLLLIVFALYAFFEQKIGFQELIEAIILFVGFCGINLTNRGAPPPAILVIILMGSTACKRPLSATQTVIKDSTYTLVEYVHDTVTVPGDSVKLVMNMPCDSNKVPFTPQTKKTNKAKVTLRKTSTGNIQIDCTCAEYEAVIKAQHKTIHQLRSEKTNTHTVEQVRYTAWYDWLSRILAAVLVGIILFNLLLALK